MKRKMRGCLLLLALLLLAGCARKEEAPETTATTEQTTEREAEVVSVETDRSVEIGGELLVGPSGSYVGFAAAEKKEWKSPETALKEGWVIQGGDCIDYGAEEITAFVRSCEAGEQGKLRIQRHFFGSENAEETVVLIDVFFDGSHYYTAMLDDVGVIWTKQPYERFVIEEVRDSSKDLLTTYYVLTDGSDPVYDENGVVQEDEHTSWVTAEYTYPLETLVTIFVGDHDYLNLDGTYNGFEEEAPSNAIAFYEQAHEKKACRLRLEWKGVKTDLIFDGRRYYLIREGSDVIRVFGHSCLMETEYGTHLALSATDGLTFGLYREDVTSYTVYIAP